MPAITLTREEQERLDAVCAELDPATHPLTQRYFDGLEDPEEREFVIEFHRQSLRRRLWGALLLDALSGHEMVNGDRVAIVFDELEKADPTRPFHKASNGETITRDTRDFIGDTIGGYSHGAMFTCNQILQKVNQGKGRGIGEAQNRFLEVVEMAVYRLLPEWYAIKCQQEAELEDYALQDA